MTTVIAIPARLASTRLAGKPLLDIAGTPMIVHVWLRACEAGLGRVIVAAADNEIVQAIEDAGGEAVLTNPDCPSGTDRIYDALKAIDPDGAFDQVINLQGDLPSIDRQQIQILNDLLSEGQADIVTLAAPITDDAERDDPNVVKAVVRFGPGARVGRARNFTRAPEKAGDGPYLHHIGIYGFKRAALERFVALPPSPLERRERLEQLRALEAGMRIDVALVDTVPTGVDTPADLEKARQEMTAKSV